LRSKGKQSLCERGGRGARADPSDDPPRRSSIPRDSGSLDDLLVDRLNVDADAVAIAAENVPGHSCLVLPCELVRQLRLHLLECRTVGRRLLHGADEVAQVAAEESELALRQHVTVARNDVREVELLE